MDFSGPPAQEVNGAVRRAVGAEVRPRYQPLVVVVIAAAAGMVLDRYAPPAFVESATATPMPSWFFAWWLLSSGCLFAWWLGHNRKRDVR